MCGSLHVEMRGLCKLNGMVCGQWVCECDGGCLSMRSPN